MAEPIGYVVVTWNQVPSLLPDLDVIGMHLSREDAEYERDVMAAETAALGRGERHVVCAVIPVGESE